MDENDETTGHETVAPATIVGSDHPLVAALRAVWPDALHDWWVGRIHNSPTSRHTESVNHLDAVLPHLLEELTKRIAAT